MIGVAARRGLGEPSAPLGLPSWHSRWVSCDCTLFSSSSSLHSSTTAHQLLSAPLAAASTTCRCVRLL